MWTYSVTGLPWHLDQDWMRFQELGNDQSNASAASAHLFQPFQWLVKVKSLSTDSSKTSPFPVSSFGNQVSFAEHCNCARTTWFVRPSSNWQIISYNHFSKLTKKAKGRSFCCSHQTQGESRWTAAEGGCWLTSSWLKKSLGQDSMFYVWNYLVKIFVTRF